jgi:hypothetical protein
MRRWTLTTLGALFVVLTVAVIAVWVRSRWVSDVYTWRAAQGEARSVASYAGGLHFHHVKQTSSVPMPPPPAWAHEAVTGRPRWQDRYASLATPIEWGAGGFGVVSGTSTASIVLALNGVNTVQAQTTVGGGGGGGTLRVNTGGGTLTMSGGMATGNVIAGNGVTTTVTPPPINLTSGTITFSNVGAFGNDHHLAVVVPYWFVTLVAGAFALVLLVAARRAWRAVWRRRAGLCRECGYDLRASSGRCPECGTEIATEGAAAVA